MSVAVDPGTPRAAPQPPPATADLEAIVGRYQRGVWRYLRVLGADADLADDLLQDTFVVALRRGLVDQGPAATFAFLRATARNLYCRSRRRRRALREVHEADRCWQVDCGSTDGDGWFAALHACREQLPERSRRLLDGAYGDDLGHKELAREHGLAIEGVKTALRRLRAALRECIERRRTP